MSTLRLDEALQLVLRYYSENGYSEDRLYAAKNTLSKLEIALSQETFKHDMEGIEAFIRQQDLPYYASCDLRHCASMVFGAMATGTVSCTNVMTPRSPCLNSVEYTSELGNYATLLRKQGKARSTVRFEVWANRELLAYLESIGITRFADISTIHLLNYQKLKIPTYAQSTGQAMILSYQALHQVSHSGEQGQPDSSPMYAVKGNAKGIGDYHTDRRAEADADEPAQADNSEGSQGQCGNPLRLEARPTEI
jgi:hypothetical protein